VNARIPSAQPAKYGVCSVIVNGSPLQQGVDYALDPVTGRVDIIPLPLAPGANAVTTYVINYNISADVTGDGFVDLNDFFQFLTDFDTTSAGADIDGNPGVDLSDFFAFLSSFDQSCL